MKSLIFLLFIPQALLAMSANLTFSFQGKKLVATYEFSSLVRNIIFSYPLVSERSSIFRSPFLNYKTTSSLVGSKRFTLRTLNLQKISLLKESGYVFSHDAGDAMLLSDLFEISKVTNILGEQEVITSLGFYYRGKLIHKWKHNDSSTWERYLLLRRSQNIISSTFGNIIVDTDMPNRDRYIRAIKKSLKFLTLKLGKPKRNPTIFFTYNALQKKPWWNDGRVLADGAYVQIALGGKLDPNDIRGKLILYHAIFSHEIAHHWNAKNLDFNAPAWIHEGGAEALAGLMTRALFANELGEYVNYRELSNKISCEKSNSDNDFHYSCGHTIFNKVLNNSAVDPFTIFKEIHALSQQTEKAVLGIFKKYASQRVIEEIQQILNSKASSLKP